MQSSSGESVPAGYKGRIITVACTQVTSAPKSFVMASPNAQPDISADNIPPPRCETITPGVVNDGWDLHLEWVGRRFSTSYLENVHLG